MTKTDKTKYLVVKGKGGMGNRMLCAVTGILYGLLTDRNIVVDWRDIAYSNDGSNTFSRFFVCADVFSENVLPDNPDISPNIWAGNLHKSMSEMLHEYDPDKHSSITIHRKYSIDINKLDYDEDVVVFWYYTGRIKALKKYLSDKYDDFAKLDENGIIRKVLTEKMILNEDIRRRIEQFKAEHKADKVIGVHIRYTDRKTDLDKYEKYLGHFLKQCPDSHIFLATDNQQVSEDYRKRYKNVFSTHKWYPQGATSMHQNDCCPDKIENGIEALVDMYLLAQCSCLIYSGYSTFSLISQILSDAPSENIIDIDRFNITVRLKKLIRELIA